MAAIWPDTVDALIDEQHRLAACRPEPWTPRASLLIGGCFVCFPTGITGPGAAGDPAWAAAATWVPADGRSIEVLVEGHAGAPYEPGLLARREGSVLASAVRALPHRPDVLIVNAAGRDHPRRAGLALHLGAVLDLPTVGVTHRPFHGTGPWPADARGASAPLLLGREEVGAWLRTRPGRRPLVAHAAWRTATDTAVEVLRLGTGTFRTPEALRRARRVARKARARAEGRASPSRGA